MIRAIALVFLAACTPDISVSKVPVDADDDGYEQEVDCDDGRADVNPTAPELCDGRDNDCDAVVDEDADGSVAFYADTDGDGFGDPDGAVEACEPPEGYVEDDTDCDDADADDHPGGIEVCNGDDEDCDGEVDNSAADAPTGYLDADGDGYGSDASLTECELPADYVSDGTDCDDADPAIHPGADEPDCADPVDYNCDGSVAFSDADGDGWAACVECDDGDGTVNPGADEVCNGADDNCDGLVDDDDPTVTDAETWYRDADADTWGNSALSTTACVEPSGFVAVAGDCDDADAARSPSLSEVCDPADLDEDCSGTADDADAGADATTFTTFYRDADADAYGDASRTVTQCDAPAGYGADGTDCDDADSAIHPGAAETDCADPTDYNCDGTVVWADADADGWAACEDCDDVDVDTNPDAAEVCNGQDDDCDTLVDDDDADVTDPATWYRDADADAWGSTLSTTACDQPTGFVAVTGDCDDTDAARSPALTERCDAANLDEDCSGTADDADAGTDPGTFTTYARDADGDTFGNATRTVTQCDAPVGYLLDATDCDDGDSAVNPAATERCNGYDDDCDALVDDDDSAVSGMSTWYADADHDGYGGDATTAACVVPSGYLSDTTDCDDTSASVYPGAPEIDGNGVDEDCDGADTPLFSGWSTPEVSLADADAAWRGDTMDEYAGYALASTDMDGDGLSDVIAGIRNSDARSANAGAAYIFYATSPTSSSTPVSAADVILPADAANDSAGSQVSAPGDVDGDGRDDLLVGAHFNSNAAISAGAVYLVSGTDHDTMADLGDAAVTVTGETAYDDLGYYLSGAGDVDGDGLGDLLLAAPFNDAGGTNAGKAYLFYAASLSGGTVSAASADHIFTGAAAGDYLGEDCSSAGDVDGDGADDFLLGAWQLNDSGLSPTGPGKAYLFLASGLGSSTALSVTSAAATFTGGSTGSGMGRAIGSGDFDGDHRSDLVITAAYADDGHTDAGAAYLYFAADMPGFGAQTTSDASVTITGDAASDTLGSRSVVGADFDGNGADDLLVGAIYADDAGTDAGAVGLFLSDSLTSCTLGDADYLFTGEAAGDRAGAYLAAGDVNGDTLPDLVIGAHRNDIGAAEAGAFYLLFTP